MTDFRGKVKRHGDMWHWSVRDENGKKVAGGEEWHWNLAQITAHEATWAAHLWLMYGRVNLLKYKPHSRGARELK